MSTITASTLRYLRTLISTPTTRTVPASGKRTYTCRASLNSFKPTAQRAIKSPRRTFATSSHLHQDTSSSLPSSTPKTHYELFPTTLPKGPPPSGPFTIDTRALRKEFLSLQAKAHPDLHPPSSKSRAEATSAYINEAYKTLSSPLPRAQYLLALRGYDVANDETAKVEDPELLMRVLEIREAVEEAGSEEEIEGLKKENEERIGESVDVLERCFREERMEDAVREAVKLRYWVNVRETLDAWEEGKEVPPLVH
ncbi:MAG: hypothetical protein M1820_008536 [Bogoriella megaspora]|nr:MAG: hypothetical protein M1820_008536 [Bogoriella megaspora]